MKKRNRFLRGKISYARAHIESLFIHDLEIIKNIMQYRNCILTGYTISEVLLRGINKE